MGTVPTNAGLFLILIVFASVIIYIEAASRTGRTYGTLVDRRRQRECKLNLVCEYRQADCMNSTPENQWKCTAVNNAMQAKMCTLKRCDQAQGMMCLDVTPRENMTQVDSDTCPLGKTCYAPATMTTERPTPAVLTDTTRAGTNEATPTPATVSPDPELASPDTPGPVTRGTTPGVVDENATDIIWSSAGQGNSTLIP